MTEGMWPAAYDRTI